MTYQKMKTQIDEIKLLGSTLDYQQTTRDIECPWCHHHERGTMLTRVDNGLLYKCYHASCPVGGQTLFIGMTGGWCSNNVCEPKSPKQYTKDTVPLDSDSGPIIANRTGLTAHELRSAGVAYVPENNTYIMPILDFFGREIGVVERAYWDRKPKAITYWHNTEAPKLHWTHTVRQGPIVAVEDWASAERVGRYVRTVAFLGTNPTKQEMYALAKTTDELWLWLDGDVWWNNSPIPLRLKRQYGALFKHVGFIRTEADPKDLSDEGIKKMLKYSGLID